MISIQTFQSMATWWGDISTVSIYCSTVWWTMSRIILPIILTCNGCRQKCPILDDRIENHSKNQLFSRQHTHTHIWSTAVEQCVSIELNLSGRMGLVHKFYVTVFCSVTSFLLFICNIKTTTPGNAVYKHTHTQTHNDQFYVYILFQRWQ